MFLNIFHSFSRNKSPINCSDSSSVRSADLRRCRKAFTPGAEAGRSRGPRAEWTSVRRQSFPVGKPNPVVAKCETILYVSKNTGTPKWMVKIMENPIKMGDLGGLPPLFLETPIYPPNNLGGFSNFHYSAVSLSCHTCMVTANHCTRITGLSLTLSDNKNSPCCRVSVYVRLVYGKLRLQTWILNPRLSWEDNTL